MTTCAMWLGLVALATQASSQASSSQHRRTQSADLSFADLPSCGTAYGCFLVMAPNYGPSALPTLHAAGAYPARVDDLAYSTDPEDYEAETCVATCRSAVFAYALVRGPNPLSVVGSEGFGAACACASFLDPNEVPVAAVSCTPGIDGIAEAVGPDDGDAKAALWQQEGAPIYHGYYTHVGEQNCDERYDGDDAGAGYADGGDSGVAASAGGSSGPCRGAASDDSKCSSLEDNCCAPASLSEAATCTDGFLPVRTGQGCFGHSEGAYECCAPPAASTGPSRTQILLAAGAASALISLAVLKILKRCFCRRSSSSGGGGGGGSSRRAAQQQPGLADNPIFDVAQFTPSTEVSVIAAAGAEVSGGGDGAVEPPPIAAAPPCFFCPITQELMRDPVLIGDGHTYERAAIAQWLGGHHSSPMTNAALDSRERKLIPNHTLRSMIIEYVEKYIESNSPPPDEPPDADDAFENPLGPLAAERETAEDEGGEPEGGGGSRATFDVEEAGPSSGRRTRMGLGGLRARQAAGGGGGAAGPPREAELAPSDLPPPEPSDLPPPDIPPPPPGEPGLPPAPTPSGPSGWAAGVLITTGPYAIEEFDPTLYDAHELDTIQVLLAQYGAEPGGLSFNILSQYNIACPRRIAEDQRRRQLFRQSQANGS